MDKGDEAREATLLGFIGFMHQVERQLYPDYYNISKLAAIIADHSDPLVAARQILDHLAAQCGLRR